MPIGHHLGLALLLLAAQPGCSLDFAPFEASASSDGGCQDEAFDTPTTIEEVSIEDADDWAPAVSGDELVIVFGSWRQGGDGGSDLWIATRSDTGQPFSDPDPIDELNTSAFESGPSLSADGLTICFESDRPGSAGLADLYVATRPDRASPFGAPNNLATVNTEEWDANCDLDSAGLSIVFVSGPADGGGAKDLWTASRPNTSSAFDAPVPLPGINTAHDEDGPSLSVDGLTLYFTSDRPGGKGGYDIYVARRESRSASFGPAVNLTALNTGRDDVHPSISRDGDRLYLNHDARIEGPPPNTHIWVANRVCQP